MYTLSNLLCNIDVIAGLKKAVGFKNKIFFTTCTYNLVPMAFSRFFVSETAQKISLFFCTVANTTKRRKVLRTKFRVHTIFRNEHKLRPLHLFRCADACKSASNLMQFSARHALPSACLALGTPCLALKSVYFCASLRRSPYP